LPPIVERQRAVGLNLLAEIEFAISLLWRLAANVAQW
jgi:hypothetical protein